MRKREIYNSELKGIVSRPEQEPKALAVTLHGIGSNEKDLLGAAEMIFDESIIISLRSPIELSPDAFSWFPVEFTATGPKHDWKIVEKNFDVLEREIKHLSKKFNVPFEKVDILGFSQGAIMILGLILKSQITLGHYICFSGRTLPEFAFFADEQPGIAKGRKVFLAHGVSDGVLPVTFARETRNILLNANVNLTYREFTGGHGLTEQLLLDVRDWLVQV